MVSVSKLTLALALALAAIVPAHISPDSLSANRQAMAQAKKLPLVVAHRGGKRWAPENSMAAFKKSVAAGADGIELDIHRCKSGELVVIHDDTLNRTAGGSGQIKDHTLQELAALDCGSWYDPAFKDERIPLLKDVLKEVNGKLTINIEIKNCPNNYPEIDAELLKVLADYPYPDKIIISSFDHLVLKKIHDKTSRYKLALLGDCAIYDLPAYARSTGATAWNPEFDCVREDTVKIAHDAGITVNTWTVNSKEGWQKAIDLGVDAIITDDPVGLQNYLKEQK